jgi:hypothetical protein
MQFRAYIHPDNSVSITRTGREHSEKKFYAGLSARTWANQQVFATDPLLFLMNCTSPECRRSWVLALNDDWFRYGPVIRPNCFKPWMANTSWLWYYTIDDREILSVRGGGFSRTDKKFYEEFEGHNNVRLQYQSEPKTLIKRFNEDRAAGIVKLAIGDLVEHNCYLTNKEYFK